MTIPAPVRGARAAFLFLSRIPVGGFPYSTEEWAWAPAYFPLVGIVVGGVVAAVHRLFFPAGPLFDGVLALAVSMLLTGALHEDGLADTFDALGGATDRAKVLTILKDSRIGTFGASALAISILGRAAALATLGREAFWALPLVACAARVGPVWQMVALPYVTPAESAKSRELSGTQWRQAAVATWWLVVLLIVDVATDAFSPGRAGALVAGLAVVTLATGVWYGRRLGGITGDFLGATEQLTELVLYGVLAWGLSEGAPIHPFG